MTVRDLMRAVAAGPAAAGWTLGEGIDELWADLDNDTGEFMAGVKLAGTGHYIGIGEPLTDLDFTVRIITSGIERANACLVVVADRINQSY